MTTKNIFKLNLLISLTLVISSTFGQGVLEVPAQFPTIQAALDVATENDEILVSPGTYNENLIWPKEINGIKLIGIGGSDQTIIDGGEQGPCLVIDNNFSPITIDDQTEIRGFTVQNPVSTSEFLGDNAAGFRIIKASPKLSDLVFRDNYILGTSTAGVGLYLSAYKGELRDCHFYNNYCNSAGEGLGVRNHGTGLYIGAIDTVRLIDCTFEGNMTDGADWAYGAGLFVSAVDQSALYISNCSFENNVSRARLNGNGGAAYLQGVDLKVFIDDSNFIANEAIDSSDQRQATGGAIDFSERGAGVTISNCTFINNKGELGMAISINQQSGNSANSLHMTNTAVQGNASSDIVEFVNYPAIYCGTKLQSLYLDNCIVAENEGPSLYVANWTQTLVDCQLYHTTIAYNKGGIAHEEIDMHMRNCILFNPDYDEFEEAPGDPEDSEFDLGYSIIEGGVTGAQFALQEQIIDVDPLFISERILIPSAQSPALGAGTTAVPSAFDILGAPRPLPIGTNPDMGAYEVDGIPSYVVIEFYIDDNQNGVKENEEALTGLGSILLDGKTIVINFTEEGIVIIPREDEDQLNIQYDPTFSTIWESNSLAEFDFDFSQADIQDTIQFGLFPNTSVTDIKTYIASEAMRCGEWVDMFITIVNDGTESYSGEVLLNIDTRISEFEFKTLPTDTAQNLFVWPITDLTPGTSQQVLLRYRAPLIVDASQVGEIYSMRSYVRDYEITSEFIYETELRCAYDPNDKLVQPNRDDDLALIDQPLNYTIRFQNTGNDYARNVSILDTIDTSLDMSSFKLVGTSHPEVLQVVITENIVTFNFENIILPDSTTNFEGSNGFVQFTINPFADIAENTLTTNTAHIFFDFNPPIVTNTTNSILVEAFPVSAVRTGNEFDVEIFPNPSSGVIYFSEILDVIDVYDIAGKKQDSFEATDKIDLQDYVEGPYILSMKLNGKTSSRKIAIIKE